MPKTPEKQGASTARSARMNAKRYASGLKQIKIWGPRDFPPELLPNLRAAAYILMDSGLVEREVRSLTNDWLMEERETAGK